MLMAALILAAPSVFAADAKAAYDKSCASCHGKDGKGQTPAGKKLGVKDYTDATVQSGLTDDQLFKAIKEGVKDGDKVKMKGFGDKLTDDEIKALVAYIRAFKK
jgi:cytochrome c6